MERQLLQTVCDLLSSRDGSIRHTISNLLGHSDDVWLDTEPLEAPVVRSQTTEAGLHLVDQDKTASVPNVLRSFGDEALWLWVNAATALDWFGHEECNLARGVEVNRFLDLLGVHLGGLLALPVAAEGVGEASVLDTLGSGHVVVPAVHGRQVLGAAHAVVCVLERQYWPVASVLTREVGRNCVGLGTARREENAFEVIGHFVLKLFRVKTHLIVLVNGRNMLQFFGLLNDFAGDSRVRMTLACGRNTSKEIEVPPSSVVEQVLHLTFGDHGCLPVVQKGRRANVFLSIFVDRLV